jgi:hypothetical protein
MWVASNDVEQVVDWFYRQSRAHFLGVFVAGDRKFDALLQAVIANRRTIDVITGPCIDMVLFSTGEFTPEGGANTPIKHISALTKWTPQLARNISNAVVMSTHEIASAMNLGIDDLPSLVLLKRGARSRNPESNRLVLRLRGAADIEFLIEFLRAFRKSLERIDETRLAGLRLSEGSLTEIENTMTNHMQETAVIIKRDERISRYAVEIRESLPHGAVESEELIAAMRSASSNEALMAKLSHLSGREPDQIESAIPAETMKRLQKTQVARRNAENRLAKLNEQMPSPDAVLRCAHLTVEEITELQAVLNRFERKLSYGLKREQVFNFLGLSEKMLDRVKKIIKLAVAIKSGGASLL